MQGEQFCGFVFCDPGRAVNVIFLTTVTVTEEGGARNYFPLSKTLNLQEIDVNNLQCEIASNCKCPFFGNSKTTNCRRTFGQPIETETLAILFQKA